MNINKVSCNTAHHVDWNGILPPNDRLVVCWQTTCVAPGAMCTWATAAKPTKKQIRKFIKQTKQWGTL